MSETQNELLSRIYLRSGWSRILPATAVAPLLVIVGEEGASRPRIHEILEGDPHSLEGLASTAWEPLHQWTDEQIGRLDEQFKDTPLEAPPATAAEVLAEEAEERQLQLAAMRDYALHLNTPEVSTLGDLVDFMVAAQILLVDGETYRINPGAPLPAEALPLTAEASAAEDSIRWKQLHERVAQQIIALFHPDDLGRADELLTTLVQLGHEVRADPEAIRAAIGNLLSEGDFSSDSDVDRVDVEGVFTLTVDWEKFSKQRISVSRP